MLLRNKLIIIAAFLGITVISSAQRIYRSNSVLAAGNFYKISIKKPGVYKIDIPFLNALGIAGANISSSTIRLYGNGGRMLGEANNRLLV